MLDAAFGKDRRARTAYKLRAGTRPIGTLSFAAFSGDGRLVGSLQSWPVLLSGDGDRAFPLVMIGPVAVLPGVQRSGIGQRLMVAALSAADERAEPALMLIGDPEYYGRFGFSAAGTGGWTLPGPFERHRLLARAFPGVALPAAGVVGPALAADPTLHAPA